MGHFAHSVLTCKIREFGQGNIASNRTRLVVHLPEITITAYDWKQLTYLTTVCKHLEFITYIWMVRYTTSPTTATSSATSVKTGWWSLPFCYIIKMLTNEDEKCSAFCNQCFEMRVYHSYTIVHWMLPYLPVRTHLCTQNSKCMCTRIWIETQGTFAKVGVETLEKPAQSLQPKETALGWSGMPTRCQASSSNTSG